MPTAVTPNFKAAWSRFNAIDKRWRTSQDLGAPGKEWWDALAAVVDALAADEPTNQFFYPFADIVRAFIDVCTKIVSGEILAFPTEDDQKEAWEIAMGPLGRAISAIRHALTLSPITLMPLEKIEDLAKVKGESGTEVGVEQIARMWGLSQQQVMNIIQGTGKVPAGHVTPHEKEFRHNEQARRRAYANAVSLWLANRPAGIFGGDEVELDDDFTPPPESIEELASQGVSVEQIGKMHRVPKETVGRVLAGETVGVGEDAGEVTLEQLEAMTSPDAPAEQAQPVKAAPRSKRS